MTRSDLKGFVCPVVGCPYQATTRTQTGVLVLGRMVVNITTMALQEGLKNHGNYMPLPDF